MDAPGGDGETESETVVLIFVNPMENPVTTDVNVDLHEYGFSGWMQIQKIGPDGPTGKSFTTTRYLDREVTFETRTAWAWEITPAE